VITDAIGSSFEGRISLWAPEMHISILADSLLQKVFYNLVDNSLTHGSSGAQEIRIRFEQHEGYGTIIYEDGGSGIADSQKERIFIRGVGSGSGLGLFLIREILEITGMSIQETGTYGSGARFEITVPSNQFRVSDDDTSDMA
jgi:signal transduction histidine kinase